MAKKSLPVLLIMLIFLILSSCQSKKVSENTDFLTDTASPANNVSTDTENSTIKIGWSSYEIDEKADIVYKNKNNTVYELKQKDLYIYDPGADYTLLPTSMANISESDFFISGVVKRIREVISIPKDSKPQLTNMFLIADVLVSDVLCSKSDTISKGDTVSIGFSYTSYTYDTELPLIQGNL